MKKENTNLPLWKVLNEQRTQGEFEAVVDHSRDAGNYPRTKIICNGKVISTTRKWATEIPVQEKEANAQYITLAVNNLHHLVEALEGMVKLCEAIDLRSKYAPHPEQLKATEALNRIS